MLREQPTNLPRFVQLFESSRKLTFDYAIGAAIAALVPLPSLWWLRALVVLVLHYKLVRGLSKLWAFSQHWRILGWFKTWHCTLRALLLALLVWFGLLIVGTFLPWLGALALGAGVFTFFWSSGSQLQHFYTYQFMRHSQAAIPANLSVEEPNDEA